MCFQFLNKLGVVIVLSVLSVQVFYSQELEGNELQYLINAKTEKIYVGFLNRMGFVFDREVSFTNSMTGEVSHNSRYRNENTGESIERKFYDDFVSLYYQRIVVTKKQFSLANKLKNDFLFSGFSFVHEEYEDEDRFRIALKNDSSFIEISNLSTKVDFENGEFYYNNLLKVSISSDLP